MVLRLPHAIAAAIRRHAAESPRVEVCGLIAADAAGAMRCLPIVNVARDAARFFEMDPRAQIDAMRALRERGERLIGIYHSHPSGPAQPSATDIARHEYPDAFCLIAAPADATVELRAFSIRAGNLSEIRIEIDAASAA